MFALVVRFTADSLDATRNHVPYLWHAERKESLMDTIEDRINHRLAAADYAERNQA